MATGLMNRNSPSTSLTSIVVCDSAEGAQAGKSTYDFLPKGWVLDQYGVPKLVTPNIVNVVDDNEGESEIGEDGYVPIFNQGTEGVFCGQPVKLQFSSRTNTTLLVCGMVGSNPVQETVKLVGGAGGTQGPYVTSVNYYTSLNYVQVTSGAATTLKITSTACKSFSAAQGILTQPELAASVDVNSQSGVILNPRLTNKEIINLDSFDIIKVSGQALGNAQSAQMYATTDGMQVYNKTTGCMSTKRNGRWDNLYLEDPLKTQYQYSQTLLNLTQIQELNDTSIPLLVTLPRFDLQQIFNGVPSIGQTLVTNTAPSVPSYITVASAGTPNTGYVTLEIKGFYNGMFLQETTDFEFTTSDYVETSQNIYSYIESITLTSCTINGGTTTNVPNTTVYFSSNVNASVFVNRISFSFSATNEFVVGSVAGGGSPYFALDGAVWSQYAGSKSVYNACNLGFLNNQSCGSMVAIVSSMFLSQYSQDPTLPTISLSTNAPITGGGYAASMLVGLEYYIIW